MVWPFVFSPWGPLIPMHVLVSRASLTAELTPIKLRVIPRKINLMQHAYLFAEPHYLILEYVMYGKLLAYLRDHRTRQDFYNFSEDSAALTSRDLTVFGYCVARGMEYLASKKVRLCHDFVSSFVFFFLIFRFNVVMQYFGTTVF